MSIPASQVLRSWEEERDGPAKREFRMPGPDEAWVGLGSNLGGREDAIFAAAKGLGVEPADVSPLYETSPWGIEDQPWFLNAVLCLRWSKGPRSLLERCLAVEESLGRVRGQRNGPRVIDLDLLILGPGVCNEAGLSLPHPGIGSRRSVLEPWGDVAPELLIPALGHTVSELRRVAVGLPGQEAHRLR